MKKVFLILAAVAMMSFSSNENLAEQEDFNDCGSNAILITSTCDSAGSCWTVGSFNGSTISFRKPTIVEYFDIKAELNRRCSSFGEVDTYLDPVSLN